MEDGALRKFYPPRDNSFKEEFQGSQFCKKELRNRISTAKLLNYILGGNTSDWKELKN